MKNNKDDKQKNQMRFAVIFGIVLGVLTFICTNSIPTEVKPDDRTFYSQALEQSEFIPYLDYVDMLDKGEIKTVYYSQTNEKMVCTIKNNNTEDNEYSYEDAIVTNYPANTDFRLDILSRGVGLVRIVETDNGSIFLQLFLNSLPLIVISIMLVYWMQSFNKVNSVKEDDIIQTSNVTFDDIIGLDETKEELDIIVGLIKNTVEGNDIGAKVPHGILLSGPPGVGKTLIAKAVSNAAGVPFINMSGSDFQEIYVGSGAKHVRELFQLARKKSPCIIFIDEFDAIGTSRASNAANSEDRKTINALLKELDGFRPLDKVFVLAATNYPEHLDPAVKRSGRFDREINIQPPRDWQDRAELFKFYLKDKKVSDDVDIETLSRTLTGYTGADIASVCNEAALVALGKGLNYINNECMETAIDKKIFKGNYSKKRVNKEDLRIVAYHEAGHAVTSILLGDKVSRASIRPTTSGVGGAVFGSDSNSQFMTKKGLETKIKVAYGGRAAEEIFMDDITTGASSDIQQASGYLEKYVSNIGFDSESGLINHSYFGSTVSEENKRRITELSKQFYKDVVKLLTANKHMVESLALELLDKETMSGKEVEEFFKTISCEEQFEQLSLELKEA